MGRILIVILGIIFVSSCTESVNPIVEILSENPSLKEVADNPDYEVQIIYTQVDRSESQIPIFTTFSYGLDSGRYFYPASTVKLPASLVALQKINALGIDGLTKDTRLEIDSAYSRQSKVLADSTAPQNIPTVAHYIKKILLVSDNDAYNRLYEFLGQDYFNSTLNSKGYGDSYIIHRLSLPRTVDENLNTNPFSFFDNGDLVYSQPPVKASGEYLPDQSILKGKGFIRGDSLINEPMDFSVKNFFPLYNQHQLIRALIFPDQFPNSTFDLTEDDRQFLLKYMSIFPSESEIEIYQDEDTYYDAFAKFLIYGSQPGEIPNHIRIFNKIGLAYGYAIDNAYIMDLKNNSEFFLSVVIHTNKNQIFNDGNYEYEETAFPFMAKLGAELLQYEKNRENRIKPDLSHLETLYK